MKEDLCRVNLCHPPVLSLNWWVLHPGLQQHPFILAVLVDPFSAVKHVPDVCGQVQHIHIPASTAFVNLTSHLTNIAWSQ